MTEGREYLAIGLMSGTSLDGVDVALCQFTQTGNDWSYKVSNAQTFPYSPEWKKKLPGAETYSGFDLISLHKEYGDYLGELVLSFLDKQKIKPHFIASHGHTIFHQPDKRITFQLGDGAFIAAKTGITTISDFRNLDVALYGQGAPLVPIGDELLFGEYGQCLNLGGFSNISFKDKGLRKAFDICPVNIALNHLMVKYFGADFDRDGNHGRAGKVNEHLLNTLNNLKYFKQPYPKSLGKEWVLEKMFPVIEASSIPIEDKLRTVYENIAVQIVQTIDLLPGITVLVTGGGAFNRFLMELIRTKTSKTILLPDRLIIEFKEALIFAFLGLLRFRNIPNCLKDVTGAKQNNTGGVIHQMQA
jgi:anhydro-N-acetylmuramic acid kinase